ncbi:hypothetical protein GCM10011507_18380 [Edaphobacter acidisoli]|uniref:TonB-dependent transporter Oar-like beta-barrel domain-containing protein n=1 Tax=Edaphobacter acidisoli TaxID=2040573 RepID=A0A916RRT4_9BACT|nr:TonB-dependent receptor [Edaphobacter acidisoli]GGA67164.1 hypothetical protein GCM10011507_18380 [Edaphobacter acidisoli]
MKTRKNLISVIVAMLLAVTVSGGRELFAQTTDDGTIICNVNDQSGAFIPNAHVMITSNSTGIAVTASAGSHQSYSSPLLRPGQYTVEVGAAGFKNATSTVTLTVGQTQIVQFELELGLATETVTVEASAPLVDPESSTLNTIKDEKTVEDLPLNTRNFNQLISLTAGTVPGNTQLTGSLPITATRGTVANTVNGIGFRSNNYRVDGLDDTENHNGQGILLYPPVEAIQEFRVQTSVPAPEFGHGGAAIEVVYKSGGNKLHGSAFEFLRNAKYLDAKNYFDPAGPIKPFHYNSYGVTLGGPVVFPHFNSGRDKTFFFFSWEGTRKSQALTYLSTVPMPAYQTGDFSAYPYKIYDPLTTTTVGGVTSRTQFAGNQINPSRFNQTGLNLLKLFPSPNLSGLVNNYVYTPASTDRRDYFDLKVDENITPSDLAFIRISHQNSSIYTPGSLPAPALGNQQGTNATYPLWQLASGYTRTMTPHVINELRAGFSRLDTVAYNGDYGLNTAEQVGIPGVNQPGDPRTTGLTAVTLSGYATLGDSGFYYALIANNNWQINDAVTWSHNNHTFKFGGEFLRRQENIFQSSNLHGSMGFGPIYTTDPAVSGTTGNSLADLLLGAPASAGISYVPGTIGKRRSDISAYAQDTWRLTAKLTLNLGLRWEAYPQFPWNEVQNRMSYFVPSLGAVYNVNTPQVPWRSGVQPRYTNFGPRVGFAYAVSQSTIVRGAYGLFYSPDVGEDVGNANPPFDGSISISNSATNFQGAYVASTGFTRPVGNNFPTLGASLFSIDQHLKIPSGSQYNVGVEQDLPSHILFSLNYVGTLGRSLLMEPNINQPTPGPGSVASRRPFPLYGDISEVAGSNSSNYNSLQMTAEKRLEKNLQFVAAYTWSHFLDYGDFVGTPQNVNNLHADYANDSSNLPNRFTLSGIYVLPIGHGQLFGSRLPRVADAFLGGWQLSTITNFYSGLPFTPTSSINTLNGSGSQRPNRIGSGELPSGQRSIHDWFNTSAFTIPSQYQFGNAGRYILQGPSTKMSDVSLSKSFAMNSSDTRSLKLRIDAFNVSNTPQFNNPNASIGSLAAGTITSAGSPITFQRMSRQLQISGKFVF